MSENTLDVVEDTELVRIQGDRLKEECLSLVVNDDASWSQAHEKISQGAAVRKEAKRRLEPYKQQLKLAKEKIQEAEKLILDPVNEGCQALVDKIASYEKERDEIIEAQVQKQREESRKAAEVMVFDMEEQGAPKEAIESAREMIDLPDAPINIPTLKGKNTIKPSWNVEIIKGKEDQIPNEYLIPVNETMRKAVADNIKKVVKARHGRIEINGVRIIPVNSSIQRSKNV